MLSAGRGGIHGRTYAGNHRQIWPACPVTHPRQKSDVAKIFSFFLKKLERFVIFFVCTTTTDLPQDNPSVRCRCRAPVRMDKSEKIFQKRRFFIDRLPKKFEYMAWKEFVAGNSRDFFRFFSEKGGFLLSVYRKKLNKGSDGFLRDRQGLSVSRTRPDGQIRKNFPKTSLFH